MKFWQKNTKNTDSSEVVQALIAQLKSKDNQIAQLLERQRESNILLKDTQQSLLGAGAPVVHSDMSNEQSNDETQINEHDDSKVLLISRVFLNKLFFVLLLVLTSWFLYWFLDTAKTAKMQSDYITQLNIELTKCRNRNVFLMRDNADQSKELDKLSLEVVNLQHKLVTKDHELTSALSTQIYRIKELEKLNTTLLNQGLQKIYPSDKRSK